MQWNHYNQLLLWFHSKCRNSKIPNKERIKMKKEKFLNNNQQHIELGEILNIKYKFCVNFTFSLFSCQCCWSIWYEACVYSCALLCASRPRQICLRSSTYRITLYGANDIVWVFFFWISCSMTYATKEKKSIRQFNVSNSVYAAEKCTTISSILLKVKSSRNNRKWESTGQCILLRYKMKEKKTVVAYAW